MHQETLGSSGKRSGANDGMQSTARSLFRRWFLIFTKPSGEEAARINLERQGYSVYCPRLLRPTLYRGRWTDRIVPLFPRYLFLQLDAAKQTLAPVGSTVGVANVVRFGSQSAVVPDGIVEDLIRRGDPQSGLHRLSGGRRLEPGSTVRIIAGVFGGLDGIFERETGDERVVVLLSLLSQETPVRVPARFVQPGLAT